MGHTITAKSTHPWAVVNMDGDVLNRYRSPPHWERDFEYSAKQPRSLIYVGPTGERYIERVAPHSTAWIAPSVEAMQAVKAAEYLYDEDDPHLLVEARNDARRLASETGQPVRVLDGWGRAFDVIEPA